mmetsp:Transcript_1965/g.3479  ORF Transcript_1965/g.3479 Transcript_1965/m.3479 type:complete len:143 (-) Transcript_1965:934-1362(-)
MVKNIKIRRLPLHLPHLLFQMTNKHIRADVVLLDKGILLASCDTREPKVRDQLAPVPHPTRQMRLDGMRGVKDKANPTQTELYFGGFYTKTAQAAELVGKTLAERAVEAGITEVRWERPGEYQGKMKVFLESFVKASGVKLR